MKKIIAMAAVAASVSTVAMADHGSMTGAYVGLNAGAAMAKAEAKYPGDAKYDNGMSGVIGGIHAGYQKDMGRVVAGLEISGSLSNQEGKDSEGANVSSIKRTNSFGAALRVGAKINRWLAYVKAGWQNAKFEVKSGDNKKNARLNAFVPGLGLETMVSRNVMLGAEWTYAMFAKKKFNVVGANNDALELKTRSSDVKVRLSYKF